MRLKKAEAWYYNKSNRDIVIDELGIRIKHNTAVDIFAQNPYLSYDKFLSSKQKGVLARKINDLIALPGKPEKSESPYLPFQISETPRISQSKSSVSIGKEEKDWVDGLEEAFPANAQPLTQEEAWAIERQKVLKNLDTAQTGDNGEVFSDNEFDLDQDDDPHF